MVAIIGTLVCQAWAAPARSASATTRATEAQHTADVLPRHPPSGGDARHDDRGGALGEVDGLVPDGVTVFDDVPAVSKLDPALLAALRRAATDAADDGVTYFVNSGWRSRAYEPWHYELRSDATHDGCPLRYADPPHDPRMQK